MSQRMKLFIFLLIINLIVVVFYLIWNYIRRKEKIGSVWMKAVMMLLCPVIGPVFVLLSLMLNVIRGDYRNSLAAINLALNIEDSETAHYAASVLQDVLNDFRSKVQTDYLLCQEENEQQVENCIKLVEYMNPILEQQVLTDLRNAHCGVTGQWNNIRELCPAIPVR